MTRPVCRFCNWAWRARAQRTGNFDLAQNFIRTPLATVQGASIPRPYGGKQRQIMVDLDPEALYAKQLSATDVSNAPTCRI